MGPIEVMRRITSELKDINGIVGVVLGGSRARGTHSPASDIDIGIYYDESLGFHVRDVEQETGKIDDGRRTNLITSLGAWGPWVNGGGWLTVGGHHVDLIFRDVNRVAEVIEECITGNVSANYQAGRPHAYINAMYMGEVAICTLLADPFERIASLKAKTAPYPERLQNAIIEWFLFEASFSLLFALDQADKDDVAYVTGCCFRTVACLNQVLFARNSEYCINEKKAAAMVDGFNVKPLDYKKRIGKEDRSGFQFVIE